MKQAIDAGQESRSSGLRTSRRVRSLAWAALPLAGALVLAGCSSSSSSSSKNSASPSATSAAPTAASTGGSAPAAVNTATFSADQQAVANAYVQFFNGANSIQQREAYIQDSATLGPALQALAGNSLVSQASATVSDVQVSGDNAVVTFSIIVGGQPLVANQQGNAVKENGQWKVGGKTVCGLVGTVATAPAVCASYAG